MTKRGKKQIARAPAIIAIALQKHTSFFNFNADLFRRKVHALEWHSFVNKSLTMISSTFAPWDTIS